MRKGAQELEALVAMQATSTIPIVFTSSDNAVERGLVASINRPGGNVTGMSWFNAELGPKRLGLLHELVANATIVALLINPNNPESARQPAELQHAASAIGLHRRPHARELKPPVSRRPVVRTELQIVHYRITIQAIPNRRSPTFARYLRDL